MENNKKIILAELLGGGRVSNLHQKYLNLLKLIVNECDKVKAKVIAYDRDSFCEIQGKVIKLSIPLETITEMEADIAELVQREDV